MDSAKLNSLARFCAYQERCIQELKLKMQKLEIEPEDFQTYILWLEDNNYLNETRFAQIFARSKFNQKQWGRNKIRFELKKRQISAEKIKKGLEEIQDEDYLQTLEKLVQQTLIKNSKLDPWQKNQKTVNYLMGRGFEMDLIVSLMKG
jgi:regulatory protein